MSATTENTELSVTEAAIRARRSAYTISKWVRDRRLPARKDPISGRVTIAVADLDKLLVGSPVTPPRKPAVGVPCLPSAPTDGR